MVTVLSHAMVNKEVVFIPCYTSVHSHLELVLNCTPHITCERVYKTDTPEYMRTSAEQVLGLVIKEIVQASLTNESFSSCKKYKVQRQKFCKSSSTQYTGIL